MRSDCGLGLRSLPPCARARVCALEPSAALATGSVIKAGPCWDAGRLSWSRSSLQRADSDAEQWQASLSDFVLFTFPLVTQRWISLCTAQPGQFAQCQNNVRGQPSLRSTPGNGKKNLRPDAGQHFSQLVLEDFCKQSVRIENNNREWRVWSLKDTYKKQETGISTEAKFKKKKVKIWCLVFWIRCFTFNSIIWNYHWPRKKQNWSEVWV